MSILYGNGFESMFNYQWNGSEYKQYSQSNELSNIQLFNISEGLNKIAIDNTSNKIYFTNNYTNTINQINKVTGAQIFSTYMSFNPPQNWQYQSQPFGTSGYYYNPQTLIYPYGVQAGVWMIKDIYIDHIPSTQTLHLDQDDGQEIYVNGNLAINMITGYCCSVQSQNVIPYLHEGWNRFQIVGQNAWISGGGPGMVWANLEVDGVYLITDGGVQNASTWNLPTSMWWYITTTNPPGLNWPDPNWYLPMFGSGPNNMEVIQGLLYQSCYGGQLQLIDGENGILMNTLYISNNLNDLQIYKNKNKIYVTNLDQNNISIIKGSNGSIIDTISVGSQPTDIVQNKDLIYVSNKSSNSVSVISANTDNVINTISVNSEPQGLQINPDTNLLYVSNNASNNISVINTLTNTIIKTIDNIPSPDSITINKNTNMIFVISNNNAVYMINGYSNEIIESISFATGINDVKINDYSNELYISNSSTYNINIYQINMSTFNNTLFENNYLYLQPEVYTPEQPWSLFTLDNVKIVNNAALLQIPTSSGYILSPVIDLGYQPAQITINVESEPQNNGFIIVYRGSNIQPNISPSGQVTGAGNILYDYYMTWNNIIPSDYLTISQYNVGNDTYRYVQYKIIMGQL